MPIGQTLEKKIQYRIKRSKNPVFMLSNFEDLSDKYQVSRALKKLIDKELIVKTGQGIYVRAKISQLSNKIIPEISLRNIALEVLQRKKIKVVPTTYEFLYNKGESTQVPTGRVIGIKSRVSRKICFNGKEIIYAKVR